MLIKNLRALNTNVTSESTGNYYSRRVIEIAVEELMERNKGRQIFGELRPRHLHINNMDRQMEISAADTSHEIVDLRFDGDVLVADIEVLDLPAGMLLKKLIPLNNDDLYSKSREELGFMLGMRSCVSYSPNMRDMQSKIVESCHIVTFDVIYDPLKFPEFFAEVVDHA